MLELRVKELFFDRPAVQAAVGRGRLKALNRIGGYLRLTARRSIRKRKGTSAPGRPPHSHVGLLRDNVFYSYDRAQDSVVVGPALLASRDQDGRPTGGMTVPQVLEQGGAIRVREVLVGGRWRRAKSNRSTGGKPTRMTTANIEPRPTMGPALDQARRADKLSEFWKDVVR